jgi:hypothetical protein
MFPRLFAAVTAMTLLVPTYGKAAGTEMHEIQDSRPTGVTPPPKAWSDHSAGPCWRATSTGWRWFCD